MSRKEYVLEDGWTFALDSREEQAFRPVRLPHDWAIGTAFDKEMEEGASQGYRSRFGIGWYRRKLEIPQKKAGCRYLLAFGGIYENSTVWVNGEEAGGHQYGYSSFTLDITELLREGDNRLEIRVDNTCRPSDRWYSGAGIYRRVKLVEVEEAHFDPWEVTVRTAIEETTARVSVRCGLPEKRIRAVLTSKDGSFRTETGGDGEELLLTVEHARLWSAEEPNLYLLTLYLMEGERIGDQISFHIGLREISLIPGKGMSVNGKRVRLKGVCLHQDVGCLGIAAGKDIYRQRLLALKEMGCNAIRAAHHTFSEEFLDLCDELGFYVYEECFDKWHGGLYGRYFQTQWQQDVDAMVKRDRNRPCIFMWGVGNEVENQGQESMLKSLEMLTEYVRSLDDRPVSCAMNPHFKREDKVDLGQIRDIQQFVDEVSDTEIYDNEERVERIKRIAQYVDVLACNYQEQWYPLIHERIPDKLILSTEVYQYFMGSLDQMQNFTDRNPVLAVRDMDHVLGSFIWTGIDYLGESMGYPAKGWGGSLIRTNGSRRPSYYLMQSYWSDKPMVHFSVMDYSLADEGVKEHWDIPMLADHWHFPQFRKTVIPYAVMSNCEEVRLYLNGKRIYVPRPEECRNHMITGFLPYLPGTVEAVGLNAGEEVCRHRVVTPGAAVQLKFMGDAWTFQEEDGHGEKGGCQAENRHGAEDRCTMDQEMAEDDPLPEGSNGCGGQKAWQIQGELSPAGRVRQMQLTVGAFDAEGNYCFRESARVRFQVEGPAEILAVDAGEITGGEPYQSDSIHLFRGQASVMLGFTGKPGRVSVYADAEGLRRGIWQTQG